MKKYLLIILVSPFFTASAQEFMGIKVDGKKDAIISVFKAKGFTPSGDMSKDVVAMKGNVGGKVLELNIVCSPTSKTVWKFSVYLPEQSTWYALKSEYEEYLKLLTEKYGEPNSKYNFFASPYEEGDGFEMTAIYAEKCHYSAFWDKGYSISISKWKQINITYENNVNIELMKKEKEQLNKNSF